MKHLHFTSLYVVKQWDVQNQVFEVAHPWDNPVLGVSKTSHGRAAQVGDHSLENLTSFSQLPMCMNFYKSLCPKSTFSSSPHFSVSDGNQDRILLPKWGTNRTTNGLYWTAQFWWQYHRISHYSQTELDSLSLILLVKPSIVWYKTIPCSKCPEHLRAPFSLVPATSAIPHTRITETLFSDWVINSYHIKIRNNTTPSKCCWLMWVKQCHKPPMTGNPPVKGKKRWWLGDGLWHCFNPH